MTDYKKTLLLPHTSFPMKANLTQKEPETLKFWDSVDAYSAMTAKNTGQKRYTLHDGPPYANGNIHLGTAMNKVLKDIIVKSKNMQGFCSEYVPGWDCHGLPIEHKVSRELEEKGKTDLPPLTIRKICRSYAEKYVNIQRKEFQRLGVFGTWDTPYLTMHPSYEAATARELARFMEKGSVVRSKKAIHWCMDCQTALAEAEVEHDQHSSPSIYVAFALPDEKIHTIFPMAKPETLAVVIWTTTPWTLPSNQAVAVHPDFEYALVQVQDAQYILAHSLVESCGQRFGWQDQRILATCKGRELEGLTARHCFLDRDCALVLAQYVTLESGTGCVHTAPGHGREDYETGLQYGLEILSPVSDTGHFISTVEHFAGLRVDESNPHIIALLEEKNRLLAQEDISHSYPHCWRCKEPVIFRATTQWFLSMEKNDLRQRALAAIAHEVRWIPAWGRERIHAMIELRPDWCISRQRNWGVPLIALLCTECGEAWFDTQWVHSVVDKFASHPTGCDFWFEVPLEELVPEGLTCSACGGTHWKKESDILDVWFDSGTSFAAVVEQREETQFPASLYLEGSDQHRGWFHSSLLASIGTRQCAPYEAVLTHGYVVDGNGRKMSKSIGNVVAPQEIIQKHGADILRMWVCSENYQDDVRIADDILSRLVDAYRRIRNTLRYILGNLGDFDPKSHAVPAESLLPLDRYALEIIHRAHTRIQQGYTDFAFHRVFHTVHNLCVTDLSAFYLDSIKDRLYASGKESTARRSAQTALWQIALVFIQDLAPVLSFTAEEAFQHLPAPLRTPANAPAGPSTDTPAQTVFASRFALNEQYLPDEQTRQQWEIIVAVRAAVNRAVEPLRRAKTIGHSLDARVTLYVSSDLAHTLTRTLTHAQIPDAEPHLRELCIVSQVAIRDLSEAPPTACTDKDIEGLALTVEPAAGEKCVRCWIYNTRCGTNPAHPALCPRCTQVIEKME